MSKSDRQKNFSVERKKKGKYFFDIIYMKTILWRKKERK